MRVLQNQDLWIHDPREERDRQESTDYKEFEVIPVEVVREILQDIINKYQDTACDEWYVIEDIKERFGLLFEKPEERCPHNLSKEECKKKCIKALFG